METGYSMPIVRTIALGKVGTMSGITCSPNGDIFVSQGPVIWQIDRVNFTGERYAGSPDVPDSKAGHRLKEARLKRSRGLSVSDLGFFVCDTDDNRVRKFEGDDLTYFAGTGEAGFADGPAFIALFRQPCSVIAFRDQLVVSDTGNNKIRIISPNGMVSSFGSSSGNIDGDFTNCGFTNPCMLCVTPKDTILLSDGATHVLREIDMDAQQVSTLQPHIADSADESFIDSLLATSIEVPPLPMQERCVRSKTSGSSIFQCPLGMAFDCLGFLYLANYSEHAILRINYESWAVTTFVGGMSGNDGGPLNKATTKWPNYVCLTKEGDIFWTEHMDNSVRFALRAVSPWFEKLNDRFPTFAQLINEGNAEDNFGVAFPSDLTLTPSPNSHSTLRIHKQILKASSALPTDNFEALKELNMPFETVRHFFSLLYGDMSLTLGSSVEKACEHARTCRIAQKVLEDKTWKRWFESLLLSTLLRLTASEMRQVLQTLVTELPMSCRTLEILTSWVLTKMDQNTREKIVLDIFTSTGITLASLESKQPPPVDIASINMRMTTHPLDTALEAIGGTLEWKKVSKIEHHPPQAPTDYLITNGNGEAVAVHSWVLYTRWPYFRSLMKSGMIESSSGQLELSSSHIPSDVLLDFLKYLYFGHVLGDDKKPRIFREEASCRWIIDNGGQFNVFTDALEQSEPSPGFELLIKHCKKATTHHISSPKIKTKHSKRKSSSH